MFSRPLRASCAKLLEPSCSGLSLAPLSRFFYARTCYAGGAGSGFGDGEDGGGAGSGVGPVVERAWLASTTRVACEGVGGAVAVGARATVCDTATACAAVRASGCVG